MKTTTLRHSKTGKTMVIETENGHSWRYEDGEECAQWLGGGARPAKETIALMVRCGYEVQS